MAEVLRIGVEAYELGVLLRDLQTRMLQHEPASHRQLRVAHRHARAQGAAKTVHFNLHWLSDTLRGWRRRRPSRSSPTLSGAARRGPGGVAASKQLVQCIDSFPAGRHRRPAWWGDGRA